MKRHALALFALVALGLGVMVAPAEAATVVRGGPCAESATAQVRGTTYTCQQGVWQVTPATVRLNYGCTYRGELARNGGVLWMCVPSSSVLKWKKAHTYCNAANTFYNRANASYNQMRAQVNAMETRMMQLSPTDQATIAPQLTTLRTNLQTLLTLMKQDRIQLREICSTV